MKNTTSTKQTNATSNSQHSELHHAINAMLNGDFSHWGKLESIIRKAACYHKNYRLIYGIANNACETVRDATDGIVTEIKIKLLKNDRQCLRVLAGYDDTHIRQYIAKSVYNHCVTRIRTISKDIISFQPVSEERMHFSCTDVHSFDVENDALLFRLIDNLPTKQRTAVTIWLRYEDEGLDYRKMADKAGVSKTAFGKSLHLAKCSLAASYRQSPPAR